VKPRPLGRTGVRVSPLCLGTMMFGAMGNPDHDECVRIVHAALDAGVTFVDTADIYAAGESEEIVGKALTGRRDGVVLATKLHFPMPGEAGSGGNSRRWIIRACEHSLRRLGTDWIDIYQLHRPDPGVDLEESLAALDDLVRAGKVRYAGTSTFPAHQIVEGQWAAQRRATTRFVTEQPPYSLLARAAEADVLPVCQQYGMGVLTWAPLAGGWLSGRYQAGAPAKPGHREKLMPALYDANAPHNAKLLAAANAFGKLADGAGISLIHLALAFVLQHPAVTSAIIGPRTMAQLDSQIEAHSVRLDTEVLDAIDAVVPPGRTLLPAESIWQPPALTDKRLRRRSAQA
jgi:aryl-alcohol dehydrogenase-like predicted oxidoreductase